MPKYIDSHQLKGTNPETLKKLQNTPKDEFGVTHLNIIYSQEEDRWYCFLQAPTKEHVAKHHHKKGFECDNNLEVDTTAEVDD